MRRRVFLSVNAQSAAVVLRIIQQMLLVPALIGGWGVAAYRDWILVFSAAGLFSMLDLGVQNYVGNEMALIWVREGEAGFRRLFSIALGLYLLLVTLGALALAIGCATLSWRAALGASALPADRLAWTLVLLALANLAVLPLGVVSSVYRMHGNLVTSPLWFIVGEAARGFGTCLLAVSGCGPLAAAGLHLAVSVLLWGGILIDLARRYGPVPLALSRPDRRELRRTVTGSLLYALPAAATPTVLTLPILMLGRMAPDGGAVLAFSTFRTLSGFVRQFVAQLCPPFGAELARLDAIGDAAAVKRLFTVGGRLASAVAGMLGGLTMIFARPFLAVWTHGAVTYDPLLLGIFIATILLLAPAQIAMVFFLNNNRPATLLAGQGCYAVGTLLFCALLIGGHSAVGAAAAAGLAEFIGIGLLVSASAMRQAGLGLGAYLARSHLIGIVALAASAAVAAAIRRWLCPGDGLAALILAGMAWTALLAPLAPFLLLGPDERAWLFGLLLRRVGRAR